MNSLKELLNRLESESKERMEDGFNDYEAISYEVGVQSTIKDIRNWLEDNAFSWEVNDTNHISLVRAE